MLTCTRKLTILIERQPPTPIPHHHTHTHTHTCSPDKNKGTVKVLQAHSDIWKLGKESIDLRVNRQKFARVQNYFPECSVIVENLESYMQEAEAQMFPANQAEEQAWVQSVIEETIPRVSYQLNHTILW